MKRLQNRNTYLYIGFLILCVFLIFLLVNKVDNSKYTKEYFNTDDNIIDCTFKIKGNYDSSYTTLQTNTSIYLDDDDTDFTFNSVRLVINNNINPNSLDLQNIKFTFNNLTNFTKIDVTNFNENTSTADFVDNNIKLYKLIPNSIRNINTQKMDHELIISNFNVDLDTDTDYQLHITIPYSSITLNYLTNFNVGKPFFRYNNKFLLKYNKDNGTFTNERTDILTLYKYNKELNTYDQNNEFKHGDTNVDLQQFNKIDLLMKKPDFKEMRDSTYVIFEQNIGNTFTRDKYMAQVNEFEKYLPFKIESKITYKNNYDTLNSVIKPTVVLPTSNGLCFDENGQNKFGIPSTNDRCILSLKQLLPGKEYILTTYLVYHKADNFDNIRISKISNIEFTISDNDISKNADILSGINFSKNKEFTKHFLENRKFNQDFLRYQHKQNVDLKTLENNLYSNMESYNL